MKEGKVDEDDEEDEGEGGTESGLKGTNVSKSLRLMEGAEEEGRTGVEKLKPPFEDEGGEEKAGGLGDGVKGTVV